MARFLPTSTPTPKQSLLILAQNLEANLGWESLPMQTPSGNSFGSNKKFAMDWASADTGEVSSQRSTSVHPSSGSMVAKNLYELQIATLKASQTATVSKTEPFFLSVFCISYLHTIPSPRDSGRVIEARPR